jgi:RNA polymerase sigma-70 factor (ECF subfamily)
LDSFSVDISSEIEGKFINKAIQEAVNKLSDPLRTVIVLFYYNDMHIKDIAKVLECFEGTVKSRLHCARKVLRKELIKSGIEFREDNDFIWKEGLKRESKGTV